MRPPSRRKRRRIWHDRWRAGRRLQISQRCPPSRGLVPVNRRGVPTADRHVKLLIQFAVEGSLSGAHSQSANASLQTSAPNRSSSIKSEQILASWLFGNRNRKVNSLNPLSGAETQFLIECFAYPRALLLQIPHRRRYMFQQTPCSRCIPQTVGHQWLANALD